jgi:hypothetical protein
MLRLCSPQVVHEVATLQTGNYTLARSTSSIPISIAPDQDPRKKKLRNAEKRKKHKQRKGSLLCQLNTLHA